MQEASVRTMSAATRVPPQTCVPFFCKLAIHGHTPADCTNSLLLWEFSGALPHVTDGNKDTHSVQRHCMMVCSASMMGKVT